LPGCRLVKLFQQSSAAYRALGYNYRQNGTILYLISHGPYGGIEITF
jgi:hypothetical protein